MLERLKKFRERLAAFEPSANPEAAMDSNYYVEEPRDSISSKVTTRLMLRPASSHILFGAIGSGKTTQLLKICDNLNAVPDMRAIYVDADRYTDISALEPGGLVALTALAMSELVQEDSSEEVKSLRSQIQKRVYGYTEEVTSYLLPVLKTFSSLEQKETINHKGILPQPKIAPQIQTDLIKLTAKLCDGLRSSYPNIVVLIDSLDRIASEQFTRIVCTDLPLIEKFGIGVAIIGTFNTLYKREERALLMQASNYSDYLQPSYDTVNDQDAAAFFANIISRRDPEGLISQEARNLLTYYSGGLIRDLINLAQSSIEEAYVNGENEVSKQAVEAAVSAFGRAQLLRLQAGEIKILKYLMKNKESYPESEEEFKLIVSRVILEYAHPQKRFVVHPAIQAALTGALR